MSKGQSIKKRALSAACLAGLLCHLALAVGARAGDYDEAFIVEPGTFANNHASTMAEVGNGDLLACWVAGTSEASPDSRIVCSRKYRDQTSWEPLTVAVEPQETSEGSWISDKFVGNPVLHRDSEGTVWLFHEAVSFAGHSAARVDYRISRDDGRTWSQGRTLAGGLTDLGHLPRNLALPIDSRRFMLPLYREFLFTYGYTVTVTVDDGNIVARETAVIPGSGHLQPSVVRTADDRVLAYLRNKNRGPILRSTYDGREWSAPEPINLPNPDSAVAAAVSRDGAVLLAYNDSDSDRSVLSIATSSDGQRFVKLRDLENRSGGSFSYPCLLVDRSGRYHVTYTYDRKTIKHVSFSGDWLARMTPAGGAAGK